jgi:hypothetical protein
MVFVGLLLLLLTFAADPCGLFVVAFATTETPSEAGNGAASLENSYYLNLNGEGAGLKDGYDFGSGADATGDDLYGDYEFYWNHEVPESGT